MGVAPQRYFGESRLSTLGFTRAIHPIDRAASRGYPVRYDCWICLYANSDRLYLQSGLRTVDAIVQFAGLEEDATVRLLKAGQSLKICESPQPGMWTLGEAGAPLSANEGAMAMIRHHHLLYTDLARPLALLGQGRQTETALSAYWTYASKAESDAGAEGV